MSKQQLEYKPVTAYTATIPILVNGVDINKGLYPVLNFKPVGAQYPYIYVPIAEFSRVGAVVKWDPIKEVISVISDYEQLKTELVELKAENKRLLDIVNTLGHIVQTRNDSIIPNGLNAYNIQMCRLEYRPVTAFTVTRPVLVNNVDINTGLYPVLNYRPVSAQYPYIYVPIAEFSRVGAKVEWDPIRQMIIVTSDYEQIKNEITQLKAENEKLRNIISTKPQTALRGNTTGNLINLGLVAEQNGWIYFSNIRDNNNLYKMKLDGTGMAKLSSEDAISINVLGDWVYYISRTNQMGIFRIRTDGTGRSRIGNQASALISVVGDWIYYSSPSAQGSIFKIHLDGTDLTLIGEFSSANNMNVVDDWIYYNLEMDGNKIYKIRTDGTERTKVSDDSSTVLNVENGWIYYDNLSDVGHLYKMRIDGTEKTKILGISPININVTREWIYYTTSVLYKMKLDGSEITLLNNNYYARLPNVIGDWIFFEVYANGRALYKMKTDGTDGSLIVTTL